MTLKQLSDATGGLSVTYLSDVERGATRPSLKTLARIADAFSVTTADLLRGVEEMGELTHESLPAGLRDLAEDDEYGPQLDEHWLRTLEKVDYKGRRPQTKHEWLELFLSLRRIIGDDGAGGRRR